MVPSLTNSFMIVKWHKMTYKKVIFADIQAFLQRLIEQYGQKYSTYGLLPTGHFKVLESLHLVCNLNYFPWVCGKTPAC